MWRFWSNVVRRIPALAWHSAFHFEAVFAAALFLLWSYNVVAGEAAMTYFGNHSVWIWSGIGLLFLYEVMKSVYQEFASASALTEAAQSRVNDLAAEIGELQRKELRLEFDYAPKESTIFGSTVKLILKSSAPSRTVHDVSVSIVEFCQIQNDHRIITDPVPIAVTDNGDMKADLHAGADFRIPFVSFEEQETIRLPRALSLGGHGNRDKAMYRITVQAVGQNAFPARATFVVGYGNISLEGSDPNKPLRLTGTFVRKIQGSGPPTRSE